MLLAGFPGYGPAHAFRQACYNGYTEIAKACLGQAATNPELLSEMLLAGFPGFYGPAHAFRWACERGHTEIAKACLEQAATNPELLRKMLLAGFPGYGPAHAFRQAFYNGYTEIAKACLEHAATNPELLSEVLLAGFPGKGPADAFRWACQNGHTEIAKAFLEASLDSKTTNDFITAYRELEPMPNTSPLVDFFNTKPLRFVSMLEQLDIKNQRFVLSALQKAANTSGPVQPDLAASIVDIDGLIHSGMQSKELFSHYLRCASVLSFMRIKVALGLFLGLFSEEKLVQQMSQRAKADVSGASMLSFIEYKKSRTRAPQTERASAAPVVDVVPEQAMPSLQQQYNLLELKEEVPDHLYCTVTFELCSNPVCWPAENGVRYFFEKDVIDSLVDAAKKKGSTFIEHPSTREPLDLDKVSSIFNHPANLEKKQECIDWLNQQKKAALHLFLSAPKDSGGSTEKLLTLLRTIPQDQRVAVLEDTLSGGSQVLHTLAKNYPDALSKTQDLLPEGYLIVKNNNQVMITSPANHVNFKQAVAEVRNDENGNDNGQHADFREGP
jgi:hypothetical protein